MSLLAKWLAKNSQKLGMAGEPLAKEYGAALQQAEDVARRTHMAAQSTPGGYEPHSYERWLHQPDFINAHDRKKSALDSLLKAVGLAGEDVRDLQAAAHADMPDIRPAQARLKPADTIDELFGADAYGELKRRPKSQSAIDDDEMYEVLTALGDDNGR